MSDDEDRNDTNPGQIAWSLIVAILGITALIVAAIYSSKFSTFLQDSDKNAHIVSSPEGARLSATINRISVCTWFFLAFPVLNVGLAGGLAYNVNQMENMAMSA